MRRTIFMPEAAAAFLLIFDAVMTIKPSEMMKHICLPILCAACAFVSCVSRRVAEQTVVQRDSLEAVVRAKDSLIEVVFADINAVTENLARIRTRENLVALARNDEGVRRPIEEIDADIAAIDRLWQKIAALQRSSAQLRKADLRIEGLEKMIRDLDAQLTAKEGEIGRLRGELSQMEARMETLAEEAAARSTEVKHLSGEKAQLEDRLNTVYYIVGAEKALRDSGIVSKQGFIGRTLTVGDTGDHDLFIRADARTLTEILVEQKKATVVTPHPADSYELITNADKVVYKLVITDPERFWSSSKVLVVSYRK